MTNYLAIILGILLVGAIALDVIMFDSSNLIYLGRKLLEFMAYISFWR